MSRQTVVRPTESRPRPGLLPVLMVLVLLGALAAGVFWFSGSGSGTGAGEQAPLHAKGRADAPVTVEEWSDFL